MPKLPPPAKADRSESPRVGSNEHAPLTHLDTICKLHEAISRTQQHIAVLLEFLRILIVALSDGLHPLQMLPYLATHGGLLVRGSGD